MLPIVTFDQYWEKHNKTKLERCEQYERSLMQQEDNHSHIVQMREKREKEQKYAELGRESRETSIMMNEDRQSEAVRAIEPQEDCIQHREEERALDRAYPEAARAIERQNQEKVKEHKRQLHHREGQQERERQLQSRARDLQKVRERVRQETWWEQDRLKYGVQDPLIEQLKRQHAQKIYHDHVVQIYREICRNEQERLRQRHQRGLDLEQAWLQLEQQQQFDDTTRDQDGDVYMDDTSN